MKMWRWVLVLLVVSGATAAQFDPSEVGFGLAGGFATATYDDMVEESRMMMGGHLGFSLTYQVQPNINTKITAGYGYFMPREDDIVYFNSDYTQKTMLYDIFVEAESNYFFTKEFYGLLGVSINMYTLKYELEDAAGTLETSAEGTNTGVDVGLGYMFNPQTGLEVKYSFIPDIAQIKVGVIYLFRPPKQK